MNGAYDGATPVTPASPATRTGPTTPASVASLLAVELRRLTSRRMVRVLAALSLVGLLAALVVTAVQSHPPTAADLERARDMAAQQATLTEANRQECLAAQQQAAQTDPTVDLGCDELVVAAAEDFLADPRFTFAAQTRSLTLTPALVLALMGFLAGASFIGADWQAGTVGSLLLFEPRRVRVGLVKATAVTIAVMAFGLLLFALVIGGFYLVAATRGDLTGTTASLVRSTMLDALRAVGLGVGAALGGFALAGVFRRTAAVLGIAVGYVILVEGILRSSWDRALIWLLSTRVTAWLMGGTTVNLPECRSVPGGGTECMSSPPIPISTGDAAAYLAALVGLALVAFLVVFRRRDVT